MGWLTVTNQQKVEILDLNSKSFTIKVNVVRGSKGGWLVCDDALSQAVPGGSLEIFAQWYSKLTPTTDIPAPRPPRPPRKTPTPDPAP